MLGGLSDFATRFMQKSQTKVGKNGEEGCRWYKGEGIVVRLVVLGEEEGGGWCEGWGSLVVGGGGEGREWRGRGESDA